MADLTQTAANVGLTDDSQVQYRRVQYGEAVTQGMPVYLKSADNKYYKADVTTSADTANAAGIALTPGAADEYGIIVESGPMDIGATLTVGETYVVSASGAISPVGDLTTGDYPTILGIAKTASKLDVDIHAGGVAKP